MSRILIAGLSVLLTASCATGYQPRYNYNEILIVNNSRQLVQNVTITVAETGRVFSCGNVAPLGICANKFARRPYQKNPLRIAWEFGNSVQQSSEFVLEVPATLNTAFPLRGVLAISPQGEIEAYFEQDSPVR